MQPLYSTSAKFHHQHTTKSPERCHGSAMWTSVPLEFVAVLPWQLIDEKRWTAVVCIREPTLCAKNLLEHFNRASQKVWCLSGNEMGVRWNFTKTKQNKTKNMTCTLALKNGVLIGVVPVVLIGILKAWVAASHKIKTNTCDFINGLE